MLVLLGESLEAAEPLASVVRLRLLDRCNVCGTQSFQVGLNSRLEVLRLLADRKLQSPLRRRRVPITQSKQCVDQLIKCRPKLSRYDADVSAQILKWIRQFLLNVPS